MAQGFLFWPGGELQRERLRVWRSGFRVSGLGLGGGGGGGGWRKLRGFRGLSGFRFRV